MSSIRLQIKDSIMHYLCDDWNNHKRGKAHKENQALFDRKDGYAIWSIIDLEMIMEKVVKGIYAVDLADHDKQIRDEVIDKYTEKLRPIVSQLRSELKNNPYAFIDLDCIAEQMKGEQNDVK